MVENHLILMSRNIWSGSMMRLVFLLLSYALRFKFGLYHILHYLRRLSREPSFLEFLVSHTLSHKYVLVSFTNIPVICWSKCDLLSMQRQFIFNKELWWENPCFFFAYRVWLKTSYRRLHPPTRSYPQLVHLKPWRLYLDVAKHLQIIWRMVLLISYLTRVSLLRYKNLQRVESYSETIWLVFIFPKV